MCLVERYLTGCLYSGELTLLVGLTLVRGLDFASLSPGNFLDVLGGLDPAQMHTIGNLRNAVFCDGDGDRMSFLLPDDVVRFTHPPSGFGHRIRNNQKGYSRV